MLNSNEVINFFVIFSISSRENDKTIYSLSTATLFDSLRKIKYKEIF